MLKYCEMNLDRASNYRKDTAWLEDKKKYNSQWLVMFEDKNLFCTQKNEPVFLTLAALLNLKIDKQLLSEAIFIGLEGEVSYFVLDLTNLNEQVLNKANQLGEFYDIRQFGPSIENQLASILILGRALCYWHRTHKFCGRCGTVNKLVEAGHSRTCTNQNCLHQTFPRTDPAVIMLVQKTFSDGIERCLLGRQASWPKGVFSTLAGFVDPGETLEKAVQREVFEESGIEVENVKYIGSQPWPFPSSIMLGFISTAVSSTIEVDQDELEQANWFTRAQLKQFTNWGDESEGFKLPRKDSISRFLIDCWINSPELA
ncbi:NADH pyrophosphatase [Pseudoalteromonas sp. NBT06-2]|uniref:NAD(+) diphosphatase n=1 Tax=Pseudoalteromonas sp. NBT06-2 TaxID=2025950 RepID=UPI000BA5804C|nr:NAD(+) diphosphatase [Pseudoalteromonas sp. NBT06-2]PAJ72569.1 NADH pyrophosphatase [Pseudoalteromonas sp. NBT06-2]